MKYLNKVFLSFVVVFFATYSFAQTKGDMVVIEPKDLVVRNLQTGNFTYVVFNKKTKQSPSEKITLVKIKVEWVFPNKRSFCFIENDIFRGMI